MSMLMQRLMSSAVYAPDGDGSGGDGGGGDAAAKATADAAAAAATATATAQENNGGGDAAAEKAAADKAASDKVAADKTAADAAAAAKAVADKAAAPTAWRDTITDPKVRAVADRYASPADMAKGIADIRAQLSRAITIPGESATPEEKAAYNKAIGVPEKVEGYEYKPPADIAANETDIAIVEAFLPLGLAAGVPKDAMKAFLDAGLKLNADFRADGMAAITEYAAEQEAALKKEWGPDYEANMNLGRRFVEVFAGGSFKEFLNTTKIEGAGMLGDHPVMAKMLSTFGRRTDEGDLMLGSTPEEKQGLQAQIDDLNAKVPPGSSGYTQPAHQAKLKGLYDALYGSQPIIGSGQRAA